MSNIHGIFFDFHNVLSKYEYDKAFDQKVYDQLDTILWKNDGEIMNRWMEGKLSSRKLYRQLSEQISQPFQKLYDDFLVGESTLELDKNLLQLIKELRSNGYTLSIISDNVDTFTTHTVPGKKLDSMFDLIINSADFGAQKRLDGTLFDRTLEALQLENFSNLLFIDDNPINSAFFESRGGEAFVYQYGDIEGLKKWLVDKHTIST